MYQHHNIISLNLNSEKYKIGKVRKLKKIEKIREMEKIEIVKGVEKVI